MPTLNYLCTHDISDEDCYKCDIHGIKYGCDRTCPDFEDVRKHMTKEERAERQKLMDILGRSDPFPYEEVSDGN